MTILEKKQYVGSIDTRKKNLETIIRDSKKTILFLTEKINESEINLKATNALLESLKK